MSHCQDNRVICCNTPNFKKTPINIGVNPSPTSEKPKLSKIKSNEEDDIKLLNLLREYIKDGFKTNIEIWTKDDYYITLSDFSEVNYNVESNLVSFTNCYLHINRVIKKEKREFNLNYFTKIVL